jgi:diguanylate cyclase (GGDEF)-like protein/PAS domain S-box-containing protein
LYIFLLIDHYAIIHLYFYSIYINSGFNPLTTKRTSDQLVKDNFHDLYEHILQSVSDGVHVINLDGLVIIENLASAKMLGWKGDSLVGKHGHKTIHHHHADQSTYHFYECPVYQTIQDGKPRFVSEDVFWKQDGTCFPVEYSIAPLLDGKGIRYGVAVIFRDISIRKENEDKLKNMAENCQLTKLPNRGLLFDRLGCSLKLAKRNKLTLAIMFIDLDKFKDINDTFGHLIGDQILQRSAIRLKNCMRESDTVARVGGDEFIILLPEITDANAIEPVAEKIIAEMSRPFICEGNHLEISCSIGIALYPLHGKDEKTLIHAADTAMYKVKNGTKNNWNFSS